MKLIIDIPDIDLTKVKNGSFMSANILNACKSGIPLDDVKAEIENATTLHMGMVGYVEAEKVIDILDNIGKAESEDKPNETNNR